jgi:hypothetical protein
VADLERHRPDAPVLLVDHLARLGDEGAARDAEVAALGELLRQERDIAEDSKYQALERTLDAIFANAPDERVLIFTQFVDTIDFLKDQLSARWPVATFHGRMKPKEKDAAIGEFHRSEARILISSEAGGEGRNLQFCAILVNYDLPWNPMKVEQRIGRLDRIGQQRDVQIYNFSLLGTVEERVLDVLGHRINAFEETIGGLDPILGQMELDVQKIVFANTPEHLDDALENYADQLEAEVARARQADEVLRDLIVDRRSFGSLAREQFDPTEQDRLANHGNKLSKMLLKHIDATIRPIGPDTYRIELGKHVKVDLPGITREQYQVTFNYHQALVDDLVDYGSFGHPLFDALLDYATGEGFRDGLTAARTIVDASHAGFVGFQFNFLVTIRSVREWREIVTIVVDCAGVEHPELRDLLLDSFDWRDSNEQAFDSGGHPDSSAMVESARDAAETILDARLREEMAVLKARRQQDYAAELRKIGQYCDYREAQARRKAAHAQEIVTRVSSSDDPEERRILPIWERRLRLDQDDLAALGRERERLERELEARRSVQHNAELLSAAWVRIVAPADGAGSDEGRDTEEIAK